MATYETKGRLTFKDENGDNYIVYPVTKKDCVEGLGDIEVRIGDIELLNTENKSSLVDAINEVLERNGMHVDETRIHEIVDEYLAQNPPESGSVDEKQIQEIIEEYLSNIPPCEPDIDDETIVSSGGVLAVNTIDRVIADDRRPVTSGAVYDEFSKAVALLKTI